MADQGRAELIDDKTAIVTPETFRSLPDYSGSIPSLTTIGKRWKRRRVYQDESKGWVTGEYAENPNPKKVTIIWRDLLVVE